jgi:WD40 repeat protein
LIVAETSREVSLWDAASGKPGKTFQVPAPEEAAGTLRTGAAVSPAGTHVAQQFIDGAAGNAVLRITDLATGKAAEDIKMGVGGAQSIAFSPDGKSLAWSSFTDGVVVWDVAANKQLATFAKGEGRPRFFGNSICFTDDGKTLAVTLANDAIELWDVAAAKLLRTVGGHETPRTNRVAVRLVIGASDRMTRSDLAFSRDGKTVGGSLGNATVRQYDTETGNEVSPSAGHLSGVIAVGSDGRTAVSVSKESVRVWDATGREVRQWALTPPAVAAAVSADAKRVATSAGGGAVQLWGAATGEKARTIETKRADVAGLGFSPDGTVLATKAELNSAVNLWDAATGEHLRTIGQDGEPVLNGGRVSIDSAGAQTPAVVFSPDGRVVAAVGDRKQVGLWDVASGVSLGEVATPAVAFAFSANGHVLATLSNTGVVTGYEVATGEKRYEFKPVVGTAAPLHGTPGGGAFSITAFTRGNASAGGLGFSADGRFVVAGTGGPTLRVWDTLTGQEVTQLKGHQGSVSVVRTVPDGRSLISGSIDTTAVVWNLDHLPRLDLTRDAPMPGGDLEALWADLAKPDPVAAATATRKLLTERTQAVALLKDRLRPVPAADEARVAKLIADLGGSFDARRKAAAELEQLGGLAAEPLRAALATNPALDLKQRLEKLLEKATVQKPTGDRLRELRAVEVLELAATPEAKRVLESLAKGAPGARLTREAQAAASRMGDQPSK